MTTKDRSAEARVGDLVEARGIHGGAAHRGEIVEILGTSGHEHYRVRWEDGHESIVFPADGVSIVRPPEDPQSAS
jgi:hypothetical protein